MQNSINETQQSVADRVFYTIGQIGYQHCVELETFSDDGVKAVFYGNYSPLYNEELIKLCQEFENAILERDGLALYD